jgi:hypothetical protein
MLELFQRYIGKHYRYHLPEMSERSSGLTFHIRVIDVRTVYGRLQVCITPADNGSGSRWVNVESLGSEVALHD